MYRLDSSFVPTSSPIRSSTPPLGSREASSSAVAANPPRPTFWRSEPPQTPAPPPPTPPRASPPIPPKKPDAAHSLTRSASYSPAQIKKLTQLFGEVPNISTQPAPTSLELSPTSSRRQRRQQKKLARATQATTPTSASQASKLAQLLGSEVTPSLCIIDARSASSCSTLASPERPQGPQGFRHFFTGDRDESGGKAKPSSSGSSGLPPYSPPAKSAARFFLSGFLAAHYSPPERPSFSLDEHLQRIEEAATNGEVLVLAQLLQSPMMDHSQRHHTRTSPHGQQQQRDRIAIYPLHIAAERGHVEAVMLLSRSDFFSLDAPNPMGKTPLIVAAECFHLRICDLLVKFGASIHLVDQITQANFLHCLARYRWPDDDDDHEKNNDDDDEKNNDKKDKNDKNNTTTALPDDPLLAKLVNVVVAASGLSLVEGTDVHGDTPLHLAVLNRSAPLVRQLLRAGASTDIRNREGATPSELAHAAPLPVDLLSLFHPRLPMQARRADGGGEEGEEEEASVCLPSYGLNEYPYTIVQKLCAQLGRPVQRLDMSYNEVPEIHEHQFFMQSKTLGLDRSLRILQLHHNALESLPRTVSALKFLSVLDVSYNRLLELPGTLASCEQLAVLNVSHNRIARLPQWLAASRRLSTFLCRDNPIEYPPPDVVEQGLEAIASFLRSRTANRPVSFLSLPPVVGMDFRHENLAAFPYQEIQQLSELDDEDNVCQAVHLSHNQIAGIDENEFFLTFRDGSRFRDNLQLLALNHNFLTSIPRCIGILRHLRVLNLSHNQLVTLPSSIGTLSRLQSLDLSYNCLRSLTNELTGCAALEHLNLACNPLAYPPAHVIKRGARAVLDALELCDQTVCVRRGDHLTRLRPAPLAIDSEFITPKQMLAEVKNRSQLVGGPLAAFHRLVGHPEGRQLFFEYLKSEYSEENLKFLDDVQLFRRSMNDAALMSIANSIFAQYFDISGPDCINISDQNRIAVQVALSEAIDSPNPDALRSIFDAAALEIEHVLANDSFRRFLVSLPPDEEEEQEEDQAVQLDQSK